MSLGSRTPVSFTHTKEAKWMRRDTNKYTHTEVKETLKMCTCRLCKHTKRARTRSRGWAAARRHDGGRTRRATTGKLSFPWQLQAGTAALSHLTATPRSCSCALKPAPSSYTLSFYQSTQNIHKAKTEQFHLKSVFFHTLTARCINGKFRSRPL